MTFFYLSISFETPEIRDLVVNGIQSVPEINQNIQSGKNNKTLRFYAFGLRKTLRTLW